MNGGAAGIIRIDADAWHAQVVPPFSAFPGLLLGRVAARSPAFPASDAAGGQRVLIGSAAGCDGGNVAVRAKGELLERVHNVLAARRAEGGSIAGAVVASYEILHRAGRPALDPLAFRELAHCRDVRSAQLLWVPGQSLTSDEDVLVPACAAFLAHRPPTGCVAPLHPGSTGTAAHRSIAEAVEHAVLEVLERDLLWHAWYGDGARAILTGDPALSPKLFEGLFALDLSVTLMLLPGPGGTACGLACLHRTGRTGQTFGARATPAADGDTLVKALDAAVYEALMVRWSMNSSAARAVWPRMCVTERYSPRGPLEHALHSFHRQDSLAHLLAGSTHCTLPNPAPGQLTAPTGLTKASISRILAERTGEDVVAVNTTVPAIGPAGTVVIRVVAPGARRLPADEQDQPPPPTARTRLPHPLG
jgi:ribosomal protein S12 methylthiotransferase accessory factor